MRWCLRGKKEGPKAVNVENRNQALLDRFYVCSVPYSFPSHVREAILLQVGNDAVSLLLVEGCKWSNSQHCLEQRDVFLNGPHGRHREDESQKRREDVGFFLMGFSLVVLLCADVGVEMEVEGFL